MVRVKIYISKDFDGTALTLKSALVSLLLTSERVQLRMTTYSKILNKLPFRAASL